MFMKILGWETNVRLLPWLRACFLPIFSYFFQHFGTRKAEVLYSLIMKITASENDTNDILQTFR